MNLNEYIGSYKNKTFLNKVPFQGKPCRVPTQVLQSLIKSYICFSIYKALQSHIFGVFSSKRSYKVLFLKEKKVSVLEMYFPPWGEMS